MRSGATSRELVAVVAELPGSSFLDYRAANNSGTDVVLTFQALPPGILGSSPWGGPSLPAGDLGGAVTVPGHAGDWISDTSAVPDRGLTPYTLAAGELVGAAWDGPDRAVIFDLVRRADPRAVVALAGLLHPRRCACRH
jgi:hypothetical protein